MPGAFAKALLLNLLFSSAVAQPLEHRYGPDQQRGYRSEREFDEEKNDFKNRDRANFLGQKIRPAPDDEFGLRRDLHRSPSIGMQR
jgi:hypothetical protein